MYWVYIIRCGDRTLYTGITTDLKRRFAEHAAGTASHYTSAHRAQKLVYSEPAPDRSSALKREAEIKRWPRQKKLRLIAGHSN